MAIGDRVQTNLHPDGVEAKGMIKALEENGLFVRVEWDEKMMWQIIQVANIHEKIQHKRNDFLQKLSTELVKNHDILCIESLNVKQMISNQSFSKSIADVSWSDFFRMLEYKARWYGKQLIRVDTYFSSTQNCSTCGVKNPQTKDVSVRSWACSTCHTVHDRDVNAARNILQEGLRLKTVGTTEIA